MKTMIRLSEAAKTDAIRVRALKSLVRKGEGETLEFKRKASFPEKIVCEMLAFANTQGGTVLIGVSDDGSIPGVKFPDEEIFAIETSLQRLVRPYIKAKHHIIEIGPQRFVVQYDICQSKRKPHYIFDPGGRKDVYVRLADKTIRASREMKEVLRRAKNPRNIKFTYGEHEAALMKYLAHHSAINVEKYTELTGLNRYRASRSLVLLVLANVLKLIPSEDGDRFCLKSTFHR